VSYVEVIVAAVEDPRTLGRARTSFANEAEIDEFVTTLAKFESGEWTSDQWRAYRLVRGTYGQRQPDVQMLRVKIPQGILDGAQLNALADVSEQYSRGFGHVTTRQNVQLHFVQLSDVEAAMRRLAESGLTTREACGNSLRNVTACPYAGVARDEAFDVTPYSEALTRYFLRHPLSSTLPRKFKVAFEGCPDDHALAAINDLGFSARVREVAGRSERGFRLTVAGGTAIMCRSGFELFDFLPAGQILEVAEAVLRVFHKLGDRQHKQRNRMKFMIKELGFERWRAEFDQALADVRREVAPRLPFEPETPPLEAAPEWPRPQPPSAESVGGQAAAAEVRGPGITPPRRVLPVTSDAYARWRATNVREQKQAGYSIVTVTLPLGDLTGAQLRILGELALAYGDGSVRTTLEQNFVLRWVRTEDVSALYARLAAASLGQDGASTLADVTSCPGAEACRLAVTQSRGLGKLLEEHLRQRPELVAAVPGLDIKISGCPNGCGQNHIAGIGFQGSTRKLDGRAIPQYFVTVGGGSDGATGTAHFGRLAAKIPARRIPEAVERLLALYEAEKQAGESATAFLRRADMAVLKARLADLEGITTAAAQAQDYVDLGEQQAFEVIALDGECAT
jgi:sulfite reductase beta subunit-like hemoprotein